MFDIIVIGGGPAGTTGALRARELGASVALVERGRMGGTCTNDGCAPTRVLAKAARLLRDTEQFTDYGMAPYQPELDIQALLARTQNTVYRLHEKKQLIDNLQQAEVSVYANAGDARFVDPHTIELANGDRLQAKKFIICAGGHARRLRFPGSELTLTHHDVWTLKAIPKSVVIVGGAATGCQLASILNAFGSKVTVLDVAPTILGTEDAAVAQAVTDGFTASGIDVITGIQGVERVEENKRGLQLTYRRHDSEHTLDCSAVIQAVGWVGNIDTLNLSAAGVNTERGYIVTDTSMQTSAAHIFAAGDINGRMMLVQSAAHEARTAAENAILGRDRGFPHHIVPHGGFTDPEYGSVGLTEAQARAQGEVVVGVAAFADLDRAVIDDRTDGFCKLIVSTESQRIVGAHVVGEQALEIVHIAATAMAGDMRIDQVAELELAYPTFNMIIGLTARRIVREMGLTPLAPEWRALRQVRQQTAEWEKPRYAPFQSS